jgi:hypothetical protein
MRAEIDKPENVRPDHNVTFAPEKGINHVEALLAFKPLEMPQLKRLKDEN